MRVFQNIKAGPWIFLGVSKNGIIHAGKIEPKQGNWPNIKSEEHIVWRRLKHLQESKRVPKDQRAVLNAFQAN